MKQNKKIVQVNGLYVEVKTKKISDGRGNPEAVSDALKELKKQMKKSGLLQELRRREAYMSPSKARRFKHNEAIKQKKRDERKAQWHGKKEEE